MNKKLRESQAFNNEFKGVLLEYSLGQALAQRPEDLSIPDEGFLAIVQEYQNFLISNDLNTYKSISSIAKFMKKEILKNYGDKINLVELAGKNHLKAWGEGDLRVSFSNQESVLFSLKMIKHSSFINTKSAGVYSLFSKYFDDEVAQKRFSDNVSFAFSIFQKKFLEKYDLQHSAGNFSEILKSAGIHDRPGALVDDQRELLYTFYEHCLNSLVKEIEMIIQSENPKFIIAIKRLCGFSAGLEKIIFCYKNKENPLLESTTYIESWRDYGISDFGDLVIKKRQESRSYIILTSPKVDIQFRIKPMNSFSTSGVKVNVSVKKKY